MWRLTFFAYWSPGHLVASGLSALAYRAERFGVSSLKHSQPQEYRHAQALDRNALDDAGASARSSGGRFMGPGFDISCSHPLSRRRAVSIHVVSAQSKLFELNG
ncbi:hypothetical protein C8R45DRAFT_983651 [Mycena sanguinolenta]|nr:hypothetical protein C8R45DRAFT_983651 [Mycena sanguinolenta]